MLLITCSCLVIILEMCDAIVGPLVLSYNRNKYFQLNVYMESTTNMLIEKPKVSFSNLEAIWKPFQPKVNA